MTVFAAADAGAGETLVVVERASNEVTLHRKNKADGLGDLLVFANPIFDAQNGAQIGSDEGHCIRLVVGKSWECSWTLIMKDGQIMSQGPDFDDGDSTLTITGGTGKYAGARGVLTVHPRADKETAYDFRYDIL
jgi:hypothetical protein